MKAPSTFLSTSFDLGVVPRNTHPILEVLGSGAWMTIEDLVQTAAMRGYTSMDAYVPTNLRVLRDAALVERDVYAGSPQIRLTELGRALLQEQSTRQALYADLFHYLFFTLYEEQRRCDLPLSGWSWVYQATCQLLWQSRPLVPTFPDQAAQMNQRLTIDHPEYTGGVHRKSPNAVELWIRELDPPFLNSQGNKRTSRARAWCSPELLGLAIDRQYREDSIPYGTPLLLDDHQLEEITTLCFLEASNLEEVLDLALSTFSFLSMHSGEWGRSVILMQELSILDVL
jgi:hypothetical protein